MSKLATVTVYTKPGCMQCEATQNRLDHRGVEYLLVDVTEDPEALAYVTGELGYQSVPVVVTPDGTSWSGFRLDRIAAL